MALPMAATRALGLQARPVKPKRSLREKASGLKQRVTSAYASYREKGLVGGRTGKPGKWLQDRWRGLPGTIIRGGLSAVPGGSRVSLGVDALLGSKRRERKGQTVNVRDPFTGTNITRTFDPKSYRGEGVAAKLGQSAPGLIAQQAYKMNPKGTLRFLASGAGRIAAGAATAAGAELGVRAYRGIRRKLREPELKARTLKEWKKSPEARVIRTKQRKERQARNAPIMRANVAARKQQLQQGRSAFAAREKLITSRSGYQSYNRSRPTITRGYNRQIGRVAPTTIRQRGAVRQYAGGSTAAVTPYRGAAKVSTYRSSTSRAAMGQRGRTRYTSSGSSYVSPSGRGTFNVMGSSRSQTSSPRPRSSGFASPSRATYANPYAGTKAGIGYKPSYARGSSSLSSSTPSRSSSSRTYAQFRSKVKVTGPGYTSPSRSSSRPSSRSSTPFARR